MTDNFTYGVAPEDYLARAKARLAENTPEALFYAAFELRCFVEARQNEYLDAQREYARSVPAPYHIGKQGKALEAIFKSDRIQQIEWLAQSDNAVIFAAWHVPVDDTLRNRAERLGKVLHQQTKWRPADDSWWVETRQMLVDTYRRAWICSQGLLMSPAFLKPKEGVIGNVVLKISGHQAEEFAANTKSGTVGVMRVDYLQEAPAEWSHDLVA